MKEDFLHYVWKHQKFSFPTTTQQGQQLEVLATGWHNKYAGPDFSNAQIVIDDLRWAGAVEIHLRSSDWYRHGHQRIQPMTTLFYMWFGKTMLRYVGTMVVCCLPWC